MLGHGGRRMAKKLECVSVIFSSRCSRCKSLLRELGCDIRREYRFISAIAADVPVILLPALHEARCVYYIEPDVRVASQVDIACSLIGARIINRTGLTGKGVTIAICDTGIYPHPDFIRKGNRITGWVDMVSQKKTPYDDNGHGTFCASLAAGDGNASDGQYKGVAPDANIVAVKAMDAAGGGTASDVLAAMQWVLDHHRELNVRVVSMSLGAVVGGFMIDAMSRGAEQLWQEGVVVVAAAGNNGPKQGTITSPGSCRSVITVGAVNDHRKRNREGASIPSFSSRGPIHGIDKPDIVAPGVAIRGAKTDRDYESGVPVSSDYTLMTGTSVACPIVAGCCALILEQYPSWSPDQVKQALLRAATPVIGNKNAEGSGLIDIAAPLGFTLEPEPEEIYAPENASHTFTGLPVMNDSSMA